MKSLTYRTAFGHSIPVDDPKHKRIPHLSKRPWPPPAGRSVSSARRCRPISPWHRWPESRTPPGRCPPHNPLLRRTLNQGIRNWPSCGKKMRVQNGISPASVVFGQCMKTELGFYPNTGARAQWHLVAAGALWFVGSPGGLRWSSCCVTADGNGGSCAEIYGGAVMLFWISNCYNSSRGIWSRKALLSWGHFL